MLSFYVGERGDVLIMKRAKLSEFFHDALVFNSLIDGAYQIAVEAKLLRWHSSQLTSSPMSWNVRMPEENNGTTFLLSNWQVTVLVMSSSWWNIINLFSSCHASYFVKTIFSWCHCNKQYLGRFPSGQLWYIYNIYISFSTLSESPCFPEFCVTPMTYSTIAAITVRMCRVGWGGT